MSDDAYARFADIIERIEFRDWRWRLGQDTDRCWLQIEFDAPDSFDSCVCEPQPALVCVRGTIGCPSEHDTEVQRGRKWFLSEHMTDSEVVQTALVAVLAATEHEAREDFRYRGAAIFGPHYDVEALYYLATENRVSVRS